jgi:uncharacterized protein
MKAKIQEDLKAALQKKDMEQVGTLRLLLAALTNKEKEGKEITQELFEQVVLSEAKKRKEAIEAFTKGNRPEQAAQEKKELEILQQYLPEQFSEEKVVQLVKQAIQETGATTPQDLGKVMAALTPKTKGKADGALVSRLVKEALGE